MDYRGALVTKELTMLDINIATVSEVCLTELRSLVEHCTGCTFFWSGNAKDEVRLIEVDFMMKYSNTKKLEGLPIGHSGGLTSLLPFAGK